jgi:hypothetical protein
MQAGRGDAGCQVGWVYGMQYYKRRPQLIPVVGIMPCGVRRLKYYLALMETSQAILQ